MKIIFQVDFNYKYLPTCLYYTPTQNQNKKTLFKIYIDFSKIKFKLKRIHFLDFYKITTH